MTLLPKQPLQFRGADIAAAATIRAEALSAEIDPTPLEVARAELDAEIEKAVEYALRHHTTFGFAEVDGHAPVVAHQHDTFDQAEPAVTLTVPRGLWQRFTHETRDLEAKRAEVEKLRAMAVVYKDQPVFELDMDDVRFLGLDREPAATP